MKDNVLVISDVHLGSPISRVKNVAKVLKNEKYNHLIINGDLFDNKHIERYKKHHWKILALIRKIAKNKEVTLIRGNHDLNSTFLIKVLGLEFIDKYELTINNKKFLFIHFHQFDSFIKKYPIITHIAESIYYFFQNIDRSKKFSRWLKRTSKTFLNVKIKIRNKAMIDNIEKILSYVSASGSIVSTTSSPTSFSNLLSSLSWTALQQAIINNKKIANLIILKSK